MVILILSAFFGRWSLFKYFLVCCALTWPSFQSWSNAAIKYSLMICLCLHRDVMSKLDSWLPSRSWTSQRWGYRSRCFSWTSNVTRIVKMFKWFLTTAGQDNSRKITVLSHLNLIQFTSSSVHSSSSLIFLWFKNPNIIPWNVLSWTFVFCHDNNILFLKIAKLITMFKK